MHEHLDALIRQHPALACCREDIDKAFSLLLDCFRTHHKLLLCGNGGSAADCEHWSGEMLKGFAHARPLPVREKKRLPALLAQHLQGGFPVVPLPSMMSMNTAYANDVHPDLIYAQGVWALGVPEDVLIGISTSGNAANVCHAVEAAMAKGMKCIGMTGRTGGKLGEICRHVIRVPETRVDRVQELHLPVYHCLCLMLEEAFFSRS